MAINQAASQDHIRLFFCEAVPDGNWAIAFERKVVVTLDRAMQIAHLQNIAFMQSVIVLGMDEDERQHTVID